MNNQIDNYRPIAFLNNKLSELIDILKDNACSVVITEPDGNIVYVNKVFENRTDYSFSEVKGKNPRILKSDETNPEKHKKLWETISEGNEWRGEFKNKRKNGELFWEYSTIYPIMDFNNKITHFLALKEDITQIKLLENSLAEATNEIKSSNEIKFEFLKLISLEIRNPFNAIVGFVQNLIKRLESNGIVNSTTYLEILKQQCVKLLNTTELLIDISEIKTETSKVKLNLLDRVFLNDFLKEIKTPISIILGILLLLKEEYNKKQEEEIITGFNVIYSDCKRIISTMDIIFECTKDENNEIRFYKKVLFRIYEEKEKLKEYSTDSESILPDAQQIINNNLISKKDEDNSEETPTEKQLPEIKLNIESSFFSFTRDENLPFETRNFYDLTIVFINTNRATLKNAKEFKEFIINTLKSGSRNFVIDLSLCNYIDSTFVGVLVFIKKEMINIKGNIVLVLNQKNIFLESFALLNLELLFEVYSDLKSALIYLK